MQLHFVLKHVLKQRLAGVAGLAVVAAMEEEGVDLSKVRLLGRGYWGDPPKAAPGHGKVWRQVMRYEIEYRLTEGCGLTEAYAKKVIDNWPDELTPK